MKRIIIYYSAFILTLIGLFLKFRGISQFYYENYFISLIILYVSAIAFTFIFKRKIQKIFWMNQGYDVENPYYWTMVDIILIHKITNKIVCLNKDYGKCWKTNPLTFDTMVRMFEHVYLVYDSKNKYSYRLIGENLNPITEDSFKGIDYLSRNLFLVTHNTDNYLQLLKKGEEDNWEYASILGEEYTRSSRSMQGVDDITVHKLRRDEVWYEYDSNGNSL